MDLWSSSATPKEARRLSGDRPRLRNEGPLSLLPSAAAAHPFLLHHQLDMFSFPPFLANLRRPLSLTCSSSTNDPNPSPARQLLPSLPPELWLLIICQATLSLPLYHTLTTPSRLAWFASLSLLSADFRALAQPELFSTVVVHSHEQLEQLVEVLERSLKLRKAVRGLHVRWREREGAEREGAGEGAKQLNERSADGWEDGVGRVARLVELREVSLSYAGGEEGRFDLNWVAGSRGEFECRPPLPVRGGG